MADRQLLKPSNPITMQASSTGGDPALDSLSEDIEEVGHEALEITDPEER